MSYELHHSINRDKKSGNMPFIKSTLDKIAYPIALLVPLSSIDQVLSIWNEKSATGVSVVLWVILFFTSIFWIFYGIIHRERVILFGHIVWVILTSIILIEIMLFS